MKSVLLSIHPKWCELIFAGKKMVEIRKTAPELKIPFKVYVYETKAKYQPTQIDSRFKCEGAGAIIGEFTCNKIVRIESRGTMYATALGEAETNRIARESYLDFYDMKDYLGDKVGFAWLISNPVIYDELKKLSEFYLPGTLSCDDFLYALYDGSGDPTRSSYASYLFTRQLRRPPQSWCYVEDRGR